MDRHHHLLLLLVCCLPLHACAKETVQESPAMIRILTEDTVSTAAPIADAIAPNAGRLSRHATLLEPVVRVSSRLIAAVRQSELELGSRARALCWTIAVYDDEASVQTFVQADGTIVVPSGAFHLTQNEAGLAALLSHELIHALVHQVPPVPPSCSSTPRRTVALFSYAEESGADMMGLNLMAEAGYDPHELLQLWQRMKRQAEGMGDEVLRHLTYDHRMGQIAQGLPQAVIRYGRANRAPQKALPSK